MSLTEISDLCEVEEEVVRGFMTYWIAKGVVKEKKFHSDISATEQVVDIRSFDITSGKNVLYVIIEEQMENAIKDDEESLTGNNAGGGSRNDTIEVRLQSDYISTFFLNLSPL